MDRRERDIGLDGAVMAAFEGLQSGLWTALPCQVTTALDTAKRTVTLQPLIKAKAQNADGSFEWISLPVIPDVPVIFPEGGGVTLTFPVKPGDECLAIFACRCIDSWWQSGGQQIQPDLRMHDLSDGFALVGIASVPRVIANISTSAAQLRSNDGQAFVEVNPTTHAIRAQTTGSIDGQAGGNITMQATGTVTLRGASIVLDGPVSATSTIVATGNVTGAGKSLATHVHSGVQSGPSNTGAPV